MAGGSEGEYKAFWDWAWAGRVGWHELLHLAEARCEAARAAGDLRREAGECSELSFLLDQVGRAQEAIAVQRRELKLYRWLGDALEVARTLGSLGDALGKAGRLHSAVRCWRLATAWFFQTGDPSSSFQGLIRTASLLKRAGRAQEAAATFRLGLSIAPEDHARWGPARILRELAELSLGPAALPGTRGSRLGVSEAQGTEPNALE